MRIPIKGLSRDLIIKSIKDVEKEINGTELVTESLSMRDLSHELIAVDYQRSLLKKGERLYHSISFNSLDDQEKEKIWIVFNPKTNKYEDVKLIDMIETKEQLELWRK